MVLKYNMSLNCNNYYTYIAVILYISQTFINVIANFSKTELCVFIQAKRSSLNTLETTEFQSMLKENKVKSDPQYEKIRNQLLRRRNDPDPPPGGRRRVKPVEDTDAEEEQLQVVRGESDEDKEDMLVSAIEESKDTEIVSELSLML